MDKEKRHPILKILLFDVSVFAGGAMVALGIFAVLFGILNYFNILSLSSIYKPLSFLPRQETKLASQGQALRGYGKNVIPSPANFTAFKYDTAKAEKLLTQYLKDTIKPKFLPAKIEVKQGLSIDGRTEDIKYQFGSMFTTNKASFSANFHYKENTNQQNDFLIFIQPENTSETTATIPLTNSLLTSYFTKPYDVSNCTKGTTSYCEDFQTLTEGKRGYGMIVTYEKSKLMSIMFTCFIPKESKDYATLKSCISP